MKARIVWAVIGVVILGVIGMRVQQSRAKAAAPPEVIERAQLVKTAKAAKERMDEKIVFTGTIKARNEVDAFTKVAGRVETITVQVGDKVKAGQVLATIEHKEIGWQAKAAEAGVDVAKANLEAAKLDLDRTEVLHRGGSVSQSQLDTARSRAQLGQAQLAQAEAAAGLAKQQVANARIESPIDGTIVRKQLNVGGQAVPQIAAFTIVDVAALRLESAVDAAQYARISKNALAQVRVSSIPKQTFEARVTIISPMLDASSRRASVELEIDNSGGKLLPNMFATAAVAVGQIEDAIVVPRDAVLLTNGGARVYRVEGKKLKGIDATVGATDGARYQIVSGVSPGDEVVVGGLAGLADGLEVKVAPTEPVGALTQKE